MYKKNQWQTRIFKYIKIYRKTTEVTSIKQYKKKDEKKSSLQYALQQIWHLFSQQFPRKIHTNKNHSSKQVFPSLAGSGAQLSIKSRLPSNSLGLSQDHSPEISVKGLPKGRTGQDTACAAPEHHSDEGARCRLLPTQDR